VGFGGFLFSQDGNESKQIDILITNEATLQFNFHNKDGIGKSFACVDGCIGIVSVKSSLDSSALTDCLFNIASIPDKQPLYAAPLIKINGYDDWPYKIVYASNGISLESLLESLNGFYHEHSEIPFIKRPNLIHVARKYVIVRVSPEGDTTRDGTALTPHSFYPMSGGLTFASADAFALFYAVSRIQGIASASRYVRYNYNHLLDNIPF